MPLAIFNCSDSFASVQMPDDLPNVQFINGEAVVEDDRQIAAMRKLAASGKVGIREKSIEDMQAAAEAAIAHAEALKSLVAVYAPGGGSAGITTSSSMAATPAQSAAEAASTAAEKAKQAKAAKDAGAAEQAG